MTSAATQATPVAIAVHLTAAAGERTRQTIAAKTRVPSTTSSAARSTTSPIRYCPLEKWNRKVVTRYMITAAAPTTSAIDSTVVHRAGCRFTRLPLSPGLGDYGRDGGPAQTLRPAAELVHGHDQLGVGPRERRHGKWRTRVGIQLLGQQTARDLVRDDPVDGVARRLEVAGVFRDGDVPLGKPQRAHEPWVARHLLGVRFDFEV